MTRILCSLWLITGIAIGIWCANAAVTASRSDVVVASLIGLAFAMVALLGGVLSLVRRRGGSLLLKAAAGLAILYAIAFFLLGGVLDREPLYAIIVAALAVLAIFTFVFLRRTVAKNV